MGAVEPRRLVLGRSTAFWLLSYAFLVMFLSTTIPTPLYRIYQEKMHFQSGVLTLIFAVYVLCLVPSLLLFGRISDRIGRRPVLILGFALVALGTLVFALAQNIAWLFAARILQGIASGIVAGAATAALAELEPEGDRRKAALASTVTNAFGGAVGPLLSGAIAEYGTAPTLLPFLVALVLMLPAAALVVMPETVAERKPFAIEPRLPNVPREILRPYLFAAAASFTVWASAALYLTLAPSYVVALLASDNPVVNGAFVSLMLVASTVAQLSGRGLPLRTSMTVGLALLPVGLACLILAGSLHSAPLLLFGTVAIGAGHGFGFLGAMAMINTIAPEARRGEVTASFIVISYLGVAIPAVAIGFGAQFAGLLPAVAVFSGIVGIMALVLLALSTRLAPAPTAPARS